MADLKDELRRLAGHAASKATPLPAAEVIRRGNRRRHRRFSRNALAGLAGVSAVAAIVVATAAGGPAIWSLRPATPLTGLPAGDTVTVATTTPTVDMTVWVTCTYEADGRIWVHAVKASFTSKAGYGVPFFAFNFTRTGTKSDGSFSSPLKEGNHVRSYATGWMAAASKGKRLLVRPDETVMVSLRAENRQLGTIYQVTNVGVILPPRPVPPG